MDRGDTERPPASAGPREDAPPARPGLAYAFEHFLGGVPALAHDREAADRAVAVLSAATALARQTTPQGPARPPAPSREREVWRRALELERENAHLRQLVVVDSLTGLANRRAYDAGFQREWRRAMRHGTPLALLLLDIDRFKRYNDAYGHAAGDECLRRVAAVIGGLARRPGDLAARYGGEEFAIVAAETSAAHAVRLAEAVRSRVEALAIGHAQSDVADRVTVSIGVAAATPRRDDPPAVLAAAADRALYAAKQAGRNRVDLATAGEGRPLAGTGAADAAPAGPSSQELRARSLAWLRRARRGE